MAWLCATAPNSSRNRPSARGRTTSRSYATSANRVGILPVKTEKWFSQKSVMTSCSCRSDVSARATRTGPSSLARRFPCWSSVFQSALSCAERTSCAVSASPRARRSRRSQMFCGGYCRASTATSAVSTGNSGAIRSHAESLTRAGWSWSSIHRSAPMVSTCATSPGRGPNPARESACHACCSPDSSRPSRPGAGASPIEPAAPPLAHPATTAATTLATPNARRERPTEWRM